MNNLTYTEKSYQTDKQIMHIALNVDDNYLIAAETLIKSIMILHENIHFHILHDNSVPTQWFTYLNQYLQSLNSYAHSIIIENKYFNNVSSDVLLPKTAWYRLLIPQLIHIDKILYLDCDILVLQKIDELYQLNIDNFYIAAVPDSIINKLDYHTLHKTLPNIVPYFNSGVMLMNLKKLRQPEFQQQLYATINQYAHSVYGDQDILNIVLQNKWLKIPIQWNYQLHTFNMLATFQVIHLLGNDMFCPTEKLAILHYTSNPKPWILEDGIYHQIWHTYSNINWKVIINSKHE